MKDTRNQSRLSAKITQQLFYQTTDGKRHHNWVEAVHHQSVIELTKALDASVLRHADAQGALFQAKVSYANAATPTLFIRDHEKGFEVSYAEFKDWFLTFCRNNPRQVVDYITQCRRLERLKIRHAEKEAKQ